MTQGAGFGRLPVWSVRLVDQGAATKPTNGGNTMTTATDRQREIVRRALFQVFGNVTTAERERLEAADLEQWRAQANGGAGWQRDAADAMAATLAEIVAEMPAHRVALIADYVAPMADRLPNGCRIVGQIENANGERFVMAETDSAQPFATWQRDEDGATFWGHYFHDRAEAMADLIERAGISTEAAA